MSGGDYLDSLEPDERLVLELGESWVESPSCNLVQATTNLKYRVSHKRRPIAKYQKLIFYIISSSLSPLSRSGYFWILGNGRLFSETLYNKMNIKANRYLPTFLQKYTCFLFLFFFFSFPFFKSSFKFFPVFQFGQKKKEMEIHTKQLPLKQLMRLPNLPEEH